MSRSSRFFRNCLLSKVLSSDLDCLGSLVPQDLSLRTPLEMPNEPIEGVSSSRKALRRSFRRSLDGAPSRWA